MSYFRGYSPLLAGSPKHLRNQPNFRVLHCWSARSLKANALLIKSATSSRSTTPADRIDLWIGTDGSPDNTAEIVRNINAPRVHLVERKERSGKTAVLNDLASRADADVFIFSDVNCAYRPDTVRKLVRHFADPSVGVVSGRTIIRGRDGQAIVEGAYYRFESWLKLRESGNGWLPGALGAVYAIRANLYKTLAPEIINDLAHPCQVVAMGYKCRFDPTAISEEAAGDDAGREFSRQTRMTAQAAYCPGDVYPAAASIRTAGDALDPAIP